MRRLHANGCSGRIDLEHPPVSVDIDPVSTAELGQRREGICCCNDAGGLVVEDARCPLETELREQAAGLSDFDQFDVYIKFSYGAGVGFLIAARRAEKTAGCGVDEGAAATVKSGLVMHLKEPRKTPHCPGQRIAEVLMSPRNRRSRHCGQNCTCSDTKWVQ